MGALLRPSERTLRRYLVIDGPCLICCNPTYNQAHRIVDGIRMQFGAGDSIAALARDFDMPRSLVEWIARAPLRELAKVRRYKRKDAATRLQNALRAIEGTSK